MGLLYIGIQSVSVWVLVYFGIQGVSVWGYCISAYRVFQYGFTVYRYTGYFRRGLVYFGI